MISSISVFHRARVRTLGSLIGAALFGTSMLLASPLAAHAQDKKTLRMSFVNVKEHPHGVGAERFAELVNAKSGGKLTVRLYPGGTLGSDMQIVSSMQGGTIDLSVMVPGSLTGVSKEFGMFDLPFLFQNAAEADAVLDGPFGTKLLAILPSKNLVGLSFWDHGFRNFTTSTKPITTVADFRGLKVRVQQIPIYVDMMRALDANPVALSFPELYGALESRAVDGQENPLTSIVGSRLHEAQKFLSITRHTYNPLVVVASKKSWDKLTEDERKILMEAANEAKPYQRKFSRDAESKALETIKAAGLKVNELAPAEVEHLRQKVQPVAEKLAQDSGAALTKELRDEVARVRAKTASVRQ
jgi:tripartite ATP-independent transporter DctP family solute receptor